MNRHAQRIASKITLAADTRRAAPPDNRNVAGAADADLNGYQEAVKSALSE